MEKAGDQPNIWRFPYTSGEARMVTVRDIVQVEQGLPRHIGFEYSVDLEATDIDEAAATAQRWAETVAFMMSSATRAPVGRLHLQLAYEITPGIDEREFRQWFWDPPIPVSKPSVNRAAFGEVRERVDELATADTHERLVWRTVLSMSWFRQALEETDPIFRFHKLMVAAEALNPLLDEHYEISAHDRRGFQGLRRLADEVGLGAAWVSTALDLRRKLFHGLRVTATELRSDAQAVLADLEGLCVRAWSLLLGIKASFPEDSVVPYPLLVKVHGKLLQADASRWSADSHPFLEPQWNVAKVKPAGDPRDVTFTMSATYTVRNVDAFGGPTAHEMWGPSGYEALKYEEGSAQQIEGEEAPRRHLPTLPDALGDETRLLAADVAALAAQPGTDEVSEYPRHILEVVAVFDRCRGLFGAVRLLALRGLEQEALILTRPMFTDALMLLEVASVDETRRIELVIGYALATLTDFEGILREASTRGDDVEEELAAVAKRRASLKEYARRHSARTRRWRVNEKLLADKHVEGEGYLDFRMSQLFAHGSAFAGEQRYTSREGVVIVGIPPSRDWARGAMLSASQSMIFAVRGICGIVGWPEPPSVPELLTRINTLADDSRSA
jgi:hypothetical protein